MVQNKTSSPRSSVAPENYRSAKVFGNDSVLRFAKHSDWYFLVVGTISMAASGVGMPSFSIVFGELADGIYDPDRHKSANRVQEMALIFLYMGLGLWFLTALGVTCFLWTSQNQTWRSRRELVRAVLKQDVAWFDQNGMDSATQILGDTNKIQGGLGDKCGTSIQFLATFLSGLIVGFVKGWQLTLVILGCVPVMGLAGFAIFKLMNNEVGSKADAYAEAGVIAHEYVSAIRTVQSYDLQSHAEHVYAAKLAVAKKAKVKKSIQAGVVVGFMWFALFGAYALSLWYGSTLIADEKHNSTTGNNWTGGDVLMVFFAVLIGGMSLGQAGPGIQSLMEAKKSVLKIGKILDRTPPVDIDANGVVPESYSAPITFEDVKFAYPTAPHIEVLKGISFDIQPQQFVALVGPSGSGKSTIIQLLERFYDPISGCIRFGETEYPRMDIRQLRRHIGLVSQEPNLFDTTIAENIRFGDPSVTQAEIEEAAKLANAHDFIVQQPNGYNTVVGEGGSQISGGQKQRIAIARALVRKPSILLLDEATSALDSTNERLVQEALERAMKGRTIVAVAHRLSTIKHADKIIVMDHGTILEQGNHNELIAANGMYASLVQQQSLGSSSVTRTVSEAAVVSKSQTVDTAKTGTDVEDEVVEEIPPETTRGNVKRLFKYMIPVWGWAVLGVLTSVMNGVIMPAFSFIFTEMMKTFYQCAPTLCEDDPSKTCYDKWTDKHKCYDDLVRRSSIVAGVFVALAVWGFISNFGGIFACAQISQAMTVRIRRIAFHSILHQNIGYFDEPTHSTGALTSKLSGDAESINDVVALSSGLYVQNLTTLIAGVVIAFVYGWELSLVLLGLFPLIAGAGGAQVKLMTGSAREGKDSQEAANKLIMESAKAFRTVVAFGAEDFLTRQIMSKLQSAFDKTRRSSIVTGMAFGLSMFIMFGMYACSFSLGAYLIRHGTRTGDDVMKVFFALACAAMGIGQTAAIAPDSTKFAAASASIFKLIDRKPEIDIEAPGKEMKLAGNVELRNVNFIYPVRPDISVMQSVSFNVGRGQRVALVGASGCGKSTIIRLLERFYDIAKGELLLDSVPIRELSVKNLRQQLGLVEQEPVLFTATIKENIRFGNPNATDEQIIAAAKEANAHNFVLELEFGYDTMIGQGHVQLSGGQKQRIAIARALVRHPAILLLDEATSALDSESERLVNEVLNTCSVGRTTIVIAHRLATIKDADMIVVMHAGEVVEIGRHDDLVAREGHYAALVHQQHLGGN